MSINERIRLVKLRRRSWIKRTTVKYDAKYAVRPRGRTSSIQMFNNLKLPIVRDSMLKTLN